MAESENDIYIGGLLTKILQTHHVLSVSFLNSQLKTKGKNRFITFNFLKKFRNFKIAVVGSDLKITQSDIDKRFNDFNGNDQFYLTLLGILDKDANTSSFVKKRFNEKDKEVTLQRFQEDWSSNKHKLNLPFVIRNSHKFILFMKDGISYVKEFEGVRLDIEIEEKEIWKIVEKNMKDLVAICLRGILSNVDYPVNQGTLQVCIDYGFIALGKKFMVENQDTFVGGGDRGIALKGSKAADKITSQRESAFDNGWSSQRTPPPGASPKYGQATPPSSSERSTPFNVSPMRTTETDDDVMSKVQVAYQNQRTFVLLGERDEAPLFIANPSHSNAKQIEMLVALKGQIESEIYIKTFNK